MTLLYDKEIRVYLPIQELNLLLEPIKHKSEHNESTEEEDDEVIRIKQSYNLFISNFSLFHKIRK